VLAATTVGDAAAMLECERHGDPRRTDVERADWLEEGFDAAQARFLMVTAITHHRVSSPLWGVVEVQKLHAELEEIASAAAQVATPERSAVLPAYRPVA
jgi:hypothetical protein